MGSRYLQGPGSRASSWANSDSRIVTLLEQADVSSSATTTIDRHTIVSKKGQPLKGGIKSACFVVEGLIESWWNDSQLGGCNRAQNGGRLLTPVQPDPSGDHNVKAV